MNKRMSGPILLSVLLLALAVMWPGAPGVGAQTFSGPPGPFVPTGSMATARVYHTTTLLPDGRVLIAGGFVNYYTVLGSAELYNPATGSFDPVSAMWQDRAAHTATRLLDGRVLVVGGRDHNVSTTGSAEVFDPATATFSLVDPLNFRRYNHIAVLLPSGKVLVAGGVSGANGSPWTWIGPAEVYDPATEEFTVVGSLNVPRAALMANLLDDGTVLVTGGNSGGYFEGKDAAEVFDPVSNNFTLVGPMTSPRNWHTATKLADGKVLVAGGIHGPIGVVYDSAEIYDPVSQTFTPVGDNMTTPRWGHTATLLPDGRVLLVGGSTGMDWRYTATAEVYDPQTNTFTHAGTMDDARGAPSVTVLQNGTVLVAGGKTAEWWGGFQPLASAEIFYPAVAPSDTTPPVIIPTVTGLAGDEGWYRSGVTVDWSVTDPESTIIASYGCGTSVIPSDTSGRSFTCSATSAGGIAFNTVTVKVDRTSPLIDILSPQPFAVSPVGTVLEFSATDATSGLRSLQAVLSDGTTTTEVTSGSSVSLPGVYSLVVEAIDVAGNVATASRSFVVYDPTDGFATGGGWFVPGGSSSDEGDALPGLDSSSPAEFGFVVKYKPGAAVPDGQLEFQYRQGDLNLHSSGMDWLVIVNNNWAKFQGTATIKGLSGEFPFRADARDGDYGGGDTSDRFVIKIWEAGASPDLAEPIYKASGDLEGGSIFIHKK